MHRIGQVAALLDIPPTTLRRACDRFAGYLSDKAGDPPLLSSGKRAPRQFSDQDVAILRFIVTRREAGEPDELIAEVLDRHQAGEEAEAVAQEMMESDVASEIAGITSTSITVLDGDDKIVLTEGEAAALGTALRQFAATQQALLSSQQALRDLLSVVINDAMSLKDTNERLRRRMRVLEEEIARMKESDWNHRLSLEERMSQLELDAEKEKKRSWWERF